MTQKSMYLPEECWELIFSSVGHHRYFEPLSLVCTLFLSITNHLRHTLTITDQTIPFLSQLLCRFQNLKNIDIRELHGNINFAFSQISRSVLDLESLSISKQRSFPVMGLRELGSKMSNLREFNCSRICSLQDSDLIVIGNSFPYLEELDISYPENGPDFSPNGCLDSQSFSCPVTDYGVHALSSKLKRLRKINISGNQLITDKSLFSLSIYCRLLREIAILDCDFITQIGISLAMRNSPNLESISVNGIGIPSVEYCFMESFVFARGLCEIDLSNSYISDELLSLVAEACLPLKKLVLSHCYCFTFVGISYLLSKYQSLVYLDLEGATFLTDDSIIELCNFLGSLTSINLSLCSKITNSSFFAITNNCRLLNIIKMERTNLGLEEFTPEIVRNFQVKSLCLAGNNSLSDECMKRVAYVCPYLEVLDVSNCSGITEDGIFEILKSCCDLRCLEMNNCGGIKNLSIEFELPKLEVLQAQGGAVNDAALAMIGKRCHGLLHLDVEGCFNVTARGVKEVVKNCKGLKEINLKWCDNVSVDIVAWMVFSRPSLKKIFPPSGFLPTENQRNFFLRHGCLICRG